MNLIHTEMITLAVTKHPVFAGEDIWRHFIASRVAEIAEKVQYVVSVSSFTIIYRAIALLAESRAVGVQFHRSFRPETIITCISRIIAMTFVILSEKWKLLR